MSEVSFVRVISCSNEDVGYAPVNLLKSSVASGKWRCKAGEKNASVVLQLERSVKIGQVDIGNNGSAFVEVLVGRSTSSVNEFSVMVPSSSFMSPAECKVQGGGNNCRVRMFASDKLIKPTSDESWDLLKVVCTQPFNKTVPFGVSFVKVYALADTKQPTNASGTTESMNRSVSNIITSNTPSSANKPLAESKSERKPQLSGTGAQSSPLPRPEVSVSEVKRSAKRSSLPEPDSSPNRKRSKGDDMPSQKNRPLSGVVFVLSGFQNPERSNLRSKAVELGAKYEADWDDDTCTHLICAFANTPKFNQVKGKGKIVSKKWIEDCYNKKALLDWRKYDMCSKDHSRSRSKSPSRDSKKTPHAGGSSDAKKNSAEELTSHLPDIFLSQSFFIHPSIDSKLKAKLERLLVTFGGYLMDKVSSATDFVIADDGTDISELEINHPEVIIVRPDWIFACQRKQKLLPHDQFAISSS